MKLYTTIFSGSEIEFVIRITPKEARNKTMESGEQAAPVNVPLLRTVRSKIGSQYITYNPIVGLDIRARKQFNCSATAPASKVYQIANIMKSIVNTFESEPYLIHGSDSHSTTVINREAINKNTRSYSIYSATVYFVPTFMERIKNPYTPGISIFVDNVEFGFMPVEEVEAFVDQIHNLDLTTFQLLAGLVDKVSTIDTKLDYLINLETNKNQQ